MTRQVTDNLYIDLEYFTPEEYYTYEAEAAAQLNVSASMVTVSVAGDTKDFAVSMSVQASSTVEATRVKDFTVDTLALFSPSITVNAVRITDVTLQSDFVITVEPQRNRAVSATLENMANLDAMAARIAVFDAGMDVSATLTAELTQVILVDFSAQLSSAVTATAVGNTFVTPSPVIFRGVGKPEINYAVTKFGSGSLFLNGSSYLYAADQGARFNIPSTDPSNAGEFTIEFWLQPTNNTTASFILGQWQDDLVENQSWKFEYLTQNNIGFYFRVGASTVLELGSEPNSIDRNQWNHIAISRQRLSSTSAVLSLFVNGIRESSSTTRSALFSTAGGEMRIGSGRGPTGVGQPRFQGYIDGFNLRIGAMLFFSADTNSITVPTTERGTATSDTDKIRLNFNENYLDQSFPKIVTFVSTLNSAFSQSTASIKVNQAEANLNTAFAQTTLGGLLIEGDFEGADCEFTLTADSTRVITTDSELSVTTDLSAENERIREGDFAGADCEFTLEASGGLLIEGDFEGADCEFNLSVQAEVSSTAIANLSSSFDLNVEFTRIVQATVDTDVIASQFTAAAKIGQALVAIEVNSTLSAQAESTLDGDVGLDVDTNLDVEFIRQRDFSSELAVSASIQVNNEVTSGATAELPVTATLTAQGGLLIEGDFAGADSEFTLTVNTELVTVTDAGLDVAATLSVDGKRTRTTESSMSVSATLSATGQEVNDILITVNANSTLTAQASVIKTTTVQMSALAFELVQGRIIKGFEASLNSQFTLTSAAQLIYIDPDLTYKIPRETRLQRIVVEDRLQIINPEQRLYVI